LGREHLFRPSRGDLSEQMHICIYELEQDDCNHRLYHRDRTKIEEGKFELNHQEDSRLYSPKEEQGVRTLCLYFFNPKREVAAKDACHQLRCKSIRVPALPGKVMSHFVKVRLLILLLVSLKK
jgi:hypothetical protein